MKFRLFITRYEIILTFIEINALFMRLSLMILFQFLFLYAPAQKEATGSIYDFNIVALNGNNIDFAGYKGKKILVVNTPWMADDNPQYAELNELYKKYQDKLVIIAFLADDFGIAPGSRKEFTNYRKKDYTVSFPIAARTVIRGKTMAPIYQWLTQKKNNHFKDSEVKWDFQKYLIDESGSLVAVFDPKIRASNPALIAAIEK